MDSRVVWLTGQLRQRRTVRERALLPINAVAALAVGGLSSVVAGLPRSTWNSLLAQIEGLRGLQGALPQPYASPLVLTLWGVAAIALVCLLTASTDEI